MRLAATFWIATLLLAAPAMALQALNPDDGAILPPDAARDVLNQCSRDVPHSVQGTWQPSKAQIGALEAGLPKALDDAMAKRGEHLDRAKTFLRQYAGFIIGGRKVIYTNAFPRSVRDDQQSSALSWRFRAVVVCDGGSAFFGVEYDPAKDTFANFAFNGSV
ncbi:MAG TPA: hypothetical protein VHE09_12255 [Rhizomicrobium sp.]|jgi:hypothetical protein|nr:hypothetical protein [Rhizomicrobium sp.]